MDTAIIVILISSGVSLFGTILMWVLNRKANKADKESKLEGKIDTLFSTVNVLGTKLNETMERDDILIEGITWLLDSLDTANLVDGNGRDYLRRINNMYVKAGKEAMKFQCLEDKGV